MQGATNEATIPTENGRNGGRMSVHRKFTNLLGYFNPFSTMPPTQDDALPARKRPRLETSTRVYTAQDAAEADTFFDTQTTDTAVAPTNTLTIAASLPSNRAFLSPSCYWTPEQDTTLTDAVKEHGKDWVAIAGLIPGRTNRQCSRRWGESLAPTPISRKMGKWTLEEDAKLTWAVRIHGSNWPAVAAMVPWRTNIQCRGRWTECLDPYADTPSRNWTPEEDATLIDGVKEHGTNWVAIAVLIPGRTNSQCSRRWAESLAPTPISRIMGKWTLEEDAKLTWAVKINGYNWPAVAAMVPCRTNIQCRGRWAECVDTYAGTFFDAQTIDTVTTPSPDDTVAVAPTNTVTIAASLQSNRAPPSASRTWTPEQDATLIKGVKELGKNWLVIALLIPGRTNRQCSRRWAESLAPTAMSRITGKWTPEEDEKLTRAVKINGYNWPAVAAMVPWRTNIQCRGRWTQWLDPYTNTGEWTPEEDAKLTAAAKKHGSGSGSGNWVAVAALVPGRTNERCRRRWLKFLDPDRSKNSAEEELDF
jgi:hypothetical protein